LVALVFTDDPSGRFDHERTGVESRQSVGAASAVALSIDCGIFVLSFYTLLELRSEVLLIGE
jgi:hypothetical protein